MSSLAIILKEKVQLQDVQEKKIKDFCGYIRDWLSDLTEEKLILTFFEDLTIRKQKLNDYYKKKFVILLGKEKIEFLWCLKLPVGTSGKIKMQIKRKTISFVRNMDGIWKQIISKSPLLTETLTKNRFRKLLLSILEAQSGFIFGVDTIRLSKAQNYPDKRLLATQIGVL